VEDDAWGANAALVDAQVSARIVVLSFMLLD